VAISRTPQHQSSASAPRVKSAYRRGYVIRQARLLTAPLRPTIGTYRCGSRRGWRQLTDRRDAGASSCGVSGRIELAGAERGSDACVAAADGDHIHDWSSRSDRTRSGRSGCRGTALTNEDDSVKIEAMNTEQIRDVRRRAAIHAALSDPARLAIVDALVVGDASPSELQTVLAMPSNLLAHHLKVLGDEGLVLRRRSEGDRRRTYLRLVPSALDGLVPGGVRPTVHLVFVCTANSARSQLAVALWRRASSVPAVSGGTHPAARIDPGAVAAARRHGLPLPRIRPRSIHEVLTADSLVITVCDNAHEELAGTSSLHWSVPDPGRVGTDAAYDYSYDELAERVHDFAPRVAAS
jgi:ArsR family transcriptional regulator, arsenate/arsenite/antimonite-responsive transcriptional repressor / arsenate reductase (thioredoxin)